MLTKEKRAQVTFTLTVIAAALIAGMLTAGCGSIEEVAVNDDAAKPTQTGGTAGTTTTGTGTGGTITSTSDGSTIGETKPATDGNPNDNMLTTDEIIAKLKVVPSRVIFVVGNPQDFDGAKYAWDVWNFPIGKACRNASHPMGSPAIMWVNGQWKQFFNYKFAVVQRIATSDELAKDKVSMDARPVTVMPPLTIDIWGTQHASTLAKDMDVVNASPPTNLECMDP